MKTKIVFVLAVLITVFSLGISQTYLNPDAPVDERTDDLLSRMTLEEKLSYIGGYNSFYIRNISRLSVPAIKMSDGPVGVRNYGNTTAYPAGVLLAASWDTAIVNQVGHGLGKDARARGVHILLAPGMNIYRIPINGRNFEYFGEDPFLASQIASAYIQGLQSEEVIATAKHYAVNSFERNRFNVSAEIDERTVQEIYYPAFRVCVQEAKAGAVMSAYNKINGVWCSHNNYLLNETLKDEWNFNGFVMSDWSATHNALGAAAGGLDLEMPSGDYMNSTNLMPYINNGTLPVSVIDDKVRRILYELFSFGFFDRDQTLSSIPLNNPETAQIALDASREGIVLLKNENILPLDTDTISSIAVVGDLAGTYVAGSGSSYTNPFDHISVYKGIDSLVNATVDVKYCASNSNLDSAYINSVFYTDSLLTAQGMHGEYFDNMTLSGAPVYTTTDTNINFMWEGATGIPGIGEDEFSVRWTGYIHVQNEGNHTFQVASDDGFRLYLNDTLFMEDWSDHAVRTEHKTAWFYPDTHKIVLEYYENGGIAEIRMGYQEIASLVNQAVQLASESDLTVICVGYGQEYEGEGWDRTFDLPEFQSEFIQEILAVNEHTIVVLFAGGAAETTDWLDETKALIHAFYPGQAGGYAIAEILFGEVNPSGKLPFSFDRTWEENPAYEDYNAAGAYDAMEYSEGIFTGYRYYDTLTAGEPLYPFGYGLSYTEFEYSNLVLEPVSETDFEYLDVQFELTNTGLLTGREIVQLYVHDLESTSIRPLKELKAFNKIELIPDETKIVNFKLDLNAFKYYKEAEGEWGFEAGDFEILIGASSKDIRLRDTFSLAVDVVRPQFIRLDPPDDERFVGLSPEFSIEFSEEVSCTGTEIQLYKYEGDELIETFSLAALNGCDTRKINFVSEQYLEPHTEYYIQIPEGFFRNQYEMDFRGFTVKDDWNFKTGASISVPNVKETEKSMVSVFPNPVNHDEVFIQFDNSYKEATIELMDIKGNVVYNDVIGQEDTYTLNVSALESGVYTICIRNKRDSFLEKLVVF
ncbi:MAG: glycoside hydrolase family 3 C-terminal domain-containing protein [Bacteroidales bacterium]|nr:glycoside hydrolase family 3 C-terminal domain-containing protein [Bacteroidales bacterium]